MAVACRSVPFRRCARRGRGSRSRPRVQSWSMDERGAEQHAHAPPSSRCRRPNRRAGCEPLADDGVAGDDRGRVHGGDRLEVGTRSAEHDARTGRRASRCRRSRPRSRRRSSVGRARRRGRRVDPTTAMPADEGADRRGCRRAHRPPRGRRASIERVDHLTALVGAADHEDAAHDPPPGRTASRSAERLHRRVPGRRHAAAAHHLLTRSCARMAGRGASSDGRRTRRRARTSRPTTARCGRSPGSSR